MKKLIFALFVAVVLSGCVPERIANLNSTKGLKYEHTALGVEVIDSYTVNRNSTYSPDALAFCVGESIDNSSNNGSVIQYATKDGVVANGVSSYSSMLLTHYIKYRLTVRPKKFGFQYMFTYINPNRI